MRQKVGQGRGSDAVNDGQDRGGDEDLVIFQTAGRQTMVKCLEGHDTQNSKWNSSALNAAKANWLRTCGGPLVTSRLSPG